MLEVSWRVTQKSLAERAHRLGAVASVVGAAHAVGFGELGELGAALAEFEHVRSREALAEHVRGRVPFHGHSLGGQGPAWLELRRHDEQGERQEAADATERAHADLGFGGGLGKKKGKRPVTKRKRQSFVIECEP